LTDEHRQTWSELVSIATIPSQLLTPEQAAAILNIAPQTLSVWRTCGRYPLRYIKVGRAVRYRLADVEEFINSRSVGAPEPATV
jgi:hypothetical protein